MRSDLTERQRRFVEAYVGEAQGNATRAAEIAGFAHPKTQGPRLLENVGVRRAIEKARASVTSSAIATREERQTFLSRMMRAEEIEPKDRLKACEVLGRMHGDFIERHEVKHEGGVIAYIPTNGRD